MDKAFSKTNNLALFLGLWFDIFPCPFAELNRAVVPTRINEYDMEQWDGDGVGWCKDQDEFLINLQEKIDHTWTEWKKNHTTDDSNSPQFSLTSSIPGLGGVCPTGNNLESILKNYFSECLPDELSRDSKPVERLARRLAGLKSDHRSVWQFEESVNRHSSYDFVSLFGNSQEAAVYAMGYEQPPAVSENVHSLATLLAHAENLGHEEMPLVEGLNVDLLPFQRQTLRWALERETTPGGIQSFHWAKIPLPPNAKDELYFNPLLGMFSKTKPENVRGGWICEQMGMGKTVISLALILSNPAPELPLSGSKTTDLSKTPKPANGQAFWKPGLLSPDTNSESQKQRRLLSRGTLVICKVSLVGQWIEEAKSKLTDPGLVYSYHGGNRNRDPKFLAQNAIVVTTYETLASDLTYHASKANNKSYCPPV